MARFRESNTNQTILVPVSYQNQLLPDSFDEGMERGGGISGDCAVYGCGGSPKSRISRP